MRVSVVADFMAFLDDAFDQLRILLRFAAHEKKRGLDVPRLEDVEDERRPFRIRSIVEGQGDIVFAARALVVENRVGWEPALRVGVRAVIGGCITICCIQ